MWKLENHFEYNISINSDKHMYTLLTSLWTKYCGYPEYNLAILGLQKTGKTHLIKTLKEENSPYTLGLAQPQISYKQTVGLNSIFYILQFLIAIQFYKQKMAFQVWDLGGKPSIRKIWESYFPESHGVIFLFDHRISQGLECLKNIMSNQEMKCIPMLVYVKNSDYYTKVQDQLSKIKQQNQSIHAINEHTPLSSSSRSSGNGRSMNQKNSGMHSVSLSTDRNIRIELLPHTRERLYEHLQDLYNQIRKLDKQIRQK